VGKCRLARYLDQVDRPQAQTNKQDNAEDYPRLPGPGRSWKARTGNPTSGWYGRTIWLGSHG